MPPTSSLCPSCASRLPLGAVVCPGCGAVVVAPDADPLLGQVIGGYTVKRRLGVGGMGAVYEALQETIAKRAALKVVHPHLARDPRMPSLLAEARAVNAIGDEGIVNVYGFGTLPDGRPWLAMELLEGELLEAKLVRQGRLAVPEVLDLAVGITQALEAAHAAGFVHRDLKPANIFVVQRPNRPPAPKLLDFGIAQRIKEGADDALGTAAYVSPEQAANVAVGAKADLYSLGCVLFELLTGQVPFPSDDVDEVLRQHRGAPRPHVRTLAGLAPPALDALVAELMAVEPTRRPPSAASVRARLEQLRAPPLEPLLPARRPAWPLALAVVGVLAAAVAGYALLATPGDATPQPDPGADAARHPTDPVAEAARRSAQNVEQALATDHRAAATALAAALQAFPKRDELEAARAQVVAALRADAHQALERDDVDGALGALASLSNLAALPPDDPLDAQVQRAATARRTGMVRVGGVFIDRYEHPNREGATPTTDVDWDDAVSLCQQAGKHLCTEQEWESACHGAARTTYPWGEALEKGRCVGRGKAVTGPSPSGTHPRCAGPEGVQDLVGNVAEWTASPLREGAPQRVLRGGSFNQSDAQLSCSARDYRVPGLGGAKHLGLRCCL